MNYQQESFFKRNSITRQSAISQLKCVSVRASRDVFSGKTSGVVHFMSPLFLSFTFTSCDLLTPTFRLCSFCISCMAKNKKEKSPWLKTKKKTGPKKKKKKVSDEGWRKTLTETA